MGKMTASQQHNKINVFCSEKTARFQGNEFEILSGWFSIGDKWYRVKPGRELKTRERRGKEEQGLWVSIDGPYKKNASQSRGKLA